LHLKVGAVVVVIVL